MFLYIFLLPDLVLEFFLVSEMLFYLVISNTLYIFKKGKTSSKR